MSSIVFQGFIFPFERLKEGAELFPWLAVCFFGRRGMGGEVGSHQVNSRAGQMVVCSCLSMASASRARPRVNYLFPPSSGERVVTNDNRYLCKIVQVRGIRKESISLTN